MCLSAISSTPLSLLPSVSHKSGQSTSSQKCVSPVNITPVECSRTIINLLYFSHPPKHTFLSGQAHLPYIDISSHPPKHTFLSGQAHLPYVDINSHSPKHTFLSWRAHLPYIDISSHSPKHTFLSGQAHLPYVDINSHPPKHAFLSGQAYVPYMCGVIEHVHYCISMSPIHVTHCDTFIK